MQNTTAPNATDATNLGLWIDGAWQTGESTIDIENPATGQTIAKVATAGEAQVNKAVAAAKAAFEDGRWHKLSPGERSQVLAKLADLLEENTDTFARIESEDTGKPYAFISKGGDVLQHLQGYFIKHQLCASSHLTEIVIKLNLALVIGTNVILLSKYF